MSSVGSGPLLLDIANKIVVSQNSFRRSDRKEIYIQHKTMAEIHVTSVNQREAVIFSAFYYQ